MKLAVNSGHRKTPTNTGFSIKTNVYEGPLELLLELIEKRKLFIGDIALAKVTDDFVTYVNSFGSLPISDSVNFILTASTLLLIKSKALLPELSMSTEEQQDIVDLNKRLALLSKIKEASTIVRQSYLENRLFETERLRVVESVFAPGKIITVANVQKSIASLLASAPKPEKGAHTVQIKKIISLEEMVDNLTKRVSSTLRMTFKEFSSGHKEEKVNVIVGFLALLELFKQGVVHVNQESNFADIHIEAQSVTVPRYN